MLRALQKLPWCLGGTGRQGSGWWPPTHPQQPWPGLLPSPGQHHQPSRALQSCVGPCPAHPSAPSQERAWVPCSTHGTQREQMECYPGQQRETTAPYSPVLGGGERLRAKICSPGKGHTRELPGEETSVDIWGSWAGGRGWGEGARGERHRSVTEGTAHQCHRGQVWAHRPGANTTTTRACGPLTPGWSQARRRQPASPPHLESR